MASANPTIEHQQPTTQKVDEWLNKSYAKIASKPTHEAHENLSQEKRKENTFIFYNLMTSEDITENILRELEAHFNRKAKSLVWKIHRDTRFRSRYQVTFFKDEDVETLVRTGITINGVRIRGNTERHPRSIRPTRYYIPNLPSFLNEEEVSSIVGDEQTAYVKQKINKNFGIPTGGFYVGINQGRREDRFLAFEGEDFKMVCLEKPRNVAPDDTTCEVPKTKTTPEVPNTNKTPEAPTTIETPEVPTPKVPATIETPQAPNNNITPKAPTTNTTPKAPATNETPKAPNTNATPEGPITNATPKAHTTDTTTEVPTKDADQGQQMDVESFNFNISRVTDFKFGEIQNNDPLALSKEEERTLRRLNKKKHLSGPDLEKRIELMNRTYCTTSPESESTKSDDTVKTTTSTMSTKRKKSTKTKRKKKSNL